MTTVIKAEGLSKSYVIRHQREVPYRTLRDSLGSAGKRLASRLAHPFVAQSARSGNEATHEEFWALKDVSFEVREGERVGIIGPNGAGKSTLLKILSRITDPTRGRVEIHGRLASLLEVGTGFHPELTGRENIYLNGAVMGMNGVDIRAKFDEIVAFAEVEQFLDTPVKRYSSGMYVRLAFAVAAHLEPDILVVDEVLAVGDMQFQKKCMGKMEEVGRGGRTVLFVSHNLTAIRTLCTRAVVLREGRLDLDASVHEAIRSYSAGFSDNSLEQTWNTDKSPGNSVVAIRRIAILDETGQVPDRLNTDDQMNVTIDYAVKAPNATVGMTVIVRDPEGTCVFSSINNHEPNWYGKSMPVGAYRTSCRIPAKFLNDGTYVVSVNVFGKEFSDQVLLRDVLRVQIDDGPSVRGDYFGRYDGYLRPFLEWSTGPLGRVE